MKVQVLQRASVGPLCALSPNRQTGVAVGAIRGKKGKAESFKSTIVPKL
jgi:hypothetical protein